MCVHGNEGTCHLVGLINVFLIVLDNNGGLNRGIRFFRLWINTILGFGLFMEFINNKKNITRFIESCFTSFVKIINLAVSNVIKGIHETLLYFFSVFLGIKVLIQSSGDFFQFCIKTQILCCATFYRRTDWQRLNNPSFLFHCLSVPRRNPLISLNVWFFFFFFSLQHNRKVTCCVFRVKATSQASSFLQHLQVEAQETSVWPEHSDGTVEGYSSEVWIITHLSPNQMLYFYFSKCISVLWVSRSASNAVHTAVLTVRYRLDIPKTFNVL